MAYVAPIHRPTSVRHALLSNFLSADEEQLIVAKANRLEIWRLSDEGRLVMLHSKQLYGTISMLHRLQPKDFDTDLLFVGTDRAQYLTLSWNHELNQFETVQTFTDPGERYMRDCHSQDRCLVDPTGKFMALHLWEGVLSVLRLPTRKPYNFQLNFLQQVRLHEVFIKASTFLYTEAGQPTIAFIYKSSADATDTQLAIYRLTENNQNAEVSRFDPKKDRIFEAMLNVGHDSLAIPIRSVQEEVKRHNFRNKESAKAHLGGLLVLGETHLFYYDELSTTTLRAELKEPSIFVAWAEYDVTRYFVADDYGRMHLLIISTEESEITGFDVREIGETSRASTLVYLGNNLLFVGSHYGDSQLYQVDLENGEGSVLTLLQTIPNNGPILDITVMDMGNREKDSRGNEYSSGQARVVTASGAHRDGSLRSMRSGVGLEDIGDLGDMVGTQRLFSLKSHNAEKVDVLLASYLTETRVFQFASDGEIEELSSFAGLVLGEETLLAANLPSGHMLQVTPKSVALLDTESGITVSSWQPAHGEITSASANDEWLLLSVGGTSLMSLSLLRNLEVAAQKDISGSDQVSCVHASPSIVTTGVVGFFATGTVSVVDLPTLNPICSESLRQTADDTSTAIDLALIQIMPAKFSPPTLFVALQDGNVTTFNYGENPTLSGKKSVVLGPRQARFHFLPQENKLYNIFATSEHPSLIYGSEGRLVYSSVTAEDAICVCPFDSEAFPNCIVLATDSNIRLSRVDNERQTHVRTLPLGETVRRVAYSPAERVFGLGCIKRDLEQGEEVITSSFKLVHESSFEPIGKPIRLDVPGEVELVEAVIRAQLPDAYGNLAERFIVGTSFLTDEHKIGLDRSHGRILFFGVDSSGYPYLVFAHDLRGGCRALAVMDGKIVAALTKTVVVAQYVETSDVTGHLDMLASYRPSTFPVDVTVDGDTIAVADLMKSTTLLQFSQSGAQGTPTLQRLSKLNRAGWSTAVSHIDDKLWLQADAKGNLVLLEYDPEGPMQGLELKVMSELNLGEMVNKIVKVAVDASANAMVVPRAFLATVEGAVYMFGTIERDHDLLMRFQERLAERIKSPGNLEFSEYRACRDNGYDGGAPERFLDGELLERFLDLDESAQREVCQGLGPSVEDMRNRVEELKRMH